MFVGAGSRSGKKGPLLIQVYSPISVSSVTFSNIPGGFRALEIIAIGRTTTTSTGAEEIRIRFNGDSGNNYGTQRQLATGTTASALQATAASSIQIGEASRTGCIANLPSTARVMIPLYDRTVFSKITLGDYMMFTNTGANSLFDVTTSGYWNPTTPVAITQIEVFLTAGNWVNGSEVALYGIS